MARRIYSNQTVNSPSGEILRKKTMRTLLKEHELKFLSEYEEFGLIYTTTVEYKVGHYFEKSRLVVHKRKLFIVRYFNQINNEDYQESCRHYPLFYYPKLSLNFDLLSAFMYLEKQKLIIKILILGTDKNFEIRFPNEEIFNTYSNIIAKSIAYSDGFGKNIFGVALRFKDFDKLNFIAQEEFLSKANTGDVLIFRGIDCPAPCQRFFTGDEYDHVAMVKRTETNLFIYEATTLSKCSELSWRTFLYQLFNLVYSKITYRRLIINTDNKEKEKQMRKELNDIATEYIAQTKGKEYDLSVGPIICSKKPRKTELKNEWKKVPGFNCSSLLTGCYYKMGVLKVKTDSRSILPSHFSQADPTTLEFNPGFSLGPEEILEFSEN